MMQLKPQNRELNAIGEVPDLSIVINEVVEQLIT